MAKRLTDRKLKSLKPAPKGERYEVRDTDVPGLLVRVTENGVRTFMLQARFPTREIRVEGKLMRKPGKGHPTRRAIGSYPAMTLEKARATAAAWVDMIKAGIDPAVAAEDAVREARRREANTFAAVAEAFVAHCRRQKHRKAGEIDLDLKREFIKPLGGRPITSITSADVRKIIEAKVDEGHAAQAHNLLGTIRRLFNWAIGRDAYGLERSPCEKLKASDVIGKRVARDRTLTDDELRAFWRATAKIEYPYGPLFRLLLLTIQRKSEVAEAVRGELDLAGRIWAIPAVRMKSDAAHVVPLSPAAAELFAALPSFTKGDHLFSTSFGLKPVNGFAKAKVRLDELMLDELREMAAKRGDDPDKVKLEKWVIHDLRRTGRTHLSALPIPDLVRELVIAHTKPWNRHRRMWSSSP
jgi:integrase